MANIRTDRDFMLFITDDKPNGMDRIMISSKRKNLHAADIERFIAFKHTYLRRLDPCHLIAHSAPALTIGIHGDGILGR